MKTIRAYAPATVGNVAAGFDVLGAALAPLDGALWGDIVTLTEADHDAFEVAGPYGSRLPRDPQDNLVLHARRLFREGGRAAPLPSLAISLEKNLPINSGLGSSSSSIVAALVAFNAWAGEAYSTFELLALAGAGESVYSLDAHLDNVAPALLGGLRLLTPDGDVCPLPFPDDLLFVVLQPALELATARARAALPREIGLPVAVEFGQNLASLVHALHTNDRALLRRTLRDVLAEPYRAGLVRGFKAVSRAAFGAGALGSSLSGSGPAVFAVAEQAAAGDIAAAMTGAFESEGVQATARICRLDQRGARLL